MLTLIPNVFVFIFYIASVSFIQSQKTIYPFKHRRLSCASAFCELIMLRDSHPDWSLGVLMGSDTIVDGISLSGIKGRLCSQCQLRQH